MLRNQSERAKHIPPWRIGWQPEAILMAELKHALTAKPEHAAHATRYGVVAPRRHLDPRQ
jgi:hypothetical protein